LKVLPRSLGVATPPPAPSPAPSIVYVITPAPLTKETDCIITNDQVANDQERNLSPEKDHLEDILSRISKGELERIMEIINQRREEKPPTALSGLKRCKACKKEKPSREFVSLRRPETTINTCKDCQKPLALSTSPGRRERDSERDKESEELELERGRMRACKKVQQNENRVRKTGADLAMRKKNENRSHKTDVDLAMRKLDGKYGASIKKD